MSKIEIKDVKYSYGKKTPYEICALQGINLTVKENKITGIIGHTGSGKSTLVNLLNGLIKPDEGQVFVEGEDIWQNPKEIGKIRFKVGMVMQYPEYQLFAETVWDDIAYGPRNMGLSEEEVSASVEKAAKFCGLSHDMLKKSPFDISGGQKRRVALAGVMAMNPSILVLDEPAAGLDPRGRKEILGGIKAYQKESQTTVIIVSHSMEDMAMYCDDVVVLSHGKVLMADCTAKVFSQRETLQEAGLDVPEISNIVYYLRQKGIDLPADLYTVEGVKDALIAYSRGKR